jgi:hypothetical protein
MKHPDREEWIPFICGESKNRKELNQHLDECPDCARQVASWRRSLRILNRWKLNRPQARATALFEPALKWALAAGLIMGLGFLIGRATMQAQPNAIALRAQIEDSVRTSLQAQMNDTLKQMEDQMSTNLSLAEARMAKASAADSQRLWRNVMDVIGTARSEDARAVQALFRQSQEQHNNEFLSLRKDLETLASLTDEELRQARYKLVQLAALNSPNSNESNP